MTQIVVLSEALRVLRHHGFKACGLALNLCARLVSNVQPCLGSAQHALEAYALRAL